MMLFRDRKRIVPVWIVLLCFICTSCARVAVKAASYGYETVKTHRAESEAEKQAEEHVDVSAEKQESSIESQIYTSKLGDMVSLRFPSALFFIDDTANALPNYHQNMDQLLAVIQRYPHHRIQVNVHFQVNKDSHIASQVASNQARNFTATLSHHINSGFASSNGDTVLRPNILNSEYDGIGNFIEVELR